MTLNFSEMSNNFMPELIELDSYWRRAVEDAICDTIKGERRLHYALRNRKKINQKLEKLGLRAGRQKLSLSAKHPSRPDSAFDQEGSDVGCNNSTTSSLEEGSQVRPEPTKSRSGSRTNRETPSENKYKSPERPLLGDGSLEKMKKSQNSFNCEPMGDDQVEAFDCVTELDKDDGDHFDRASIYNEDDKSKIQWLHIREDTDFEESDSEMSSGPSNEEIDNSGFDKLTTLRHSFSAKAAGNGKKTRYLPSKGGFLWGKGGKRSLEERLHLALAKRNVINQEEQKSSSRTGLGGKKVRITASGARVIRRRRKKGHATSSAFIQLYLEVYRELFGKRSLREIASEATRRWRCLSAKLKSKHANKKSKK